MKNNSETQAETAATSETTYNKENNSDVTAAPSTAPDDRRDSGFHTMTRITDFTSSSPVATSVANDREIATVTSEATTEFAATTEFVATTEFAATLPKAAKSSSGNGAGAGNPRPVSDSQIQEAKNVADELYKNFNKVQAKQYLYKSDNFSRLVTEFFVENLKFEGMRIDDAMRRYFQSVDLIGETHARERALVYFSQRYRNCNPHLYDGIQANVHYLVCAIVLLNTDLHHLGGTVLRHNGSTTSMLTASLTRASSTRHRMTCKEFIRNVQGRAEDDVIVKYEDDHLKEVYKAIRKRPILSPLQYQISHAVAANAAIQSSSSSSLPSTLLSSTASSKSTRSLTSSSIAMSRSQSTRRGPVGEPQQQGDNQGSNSTRTSSSGRNNRSMKVSKVKNKKISRQQGVLYKKHVIEADGSRTPKRRRRWKLFMVHLENLDLVFTKKGTTEVEKLSIHHSLAEVEIEKTLSRRPHIIRITHANNAVVLLQSDNDVERMEWVKAINNNAALLSAAPLSAAVGSALRFQKPLQPSSCSSLPLTTQMHQQQLRLEGILEEVEEMKTTNNDDDDGKDLSEQQKQYNMDKEKFLTSETRKYTAYTRILATLHDNGNQNKTTAMTMTNTQQQQVDKNKTTTTTEIREEDEEEEEVTTFGGHHSDNFLESSNSSTSQISISPSEPNAASSGSHRNSVINNSTGSQPEVTSLRHRSLATTVSSSSSLCPTSSLPNLPACNNSKQPPTSSSSSTATSTGSRRHRSHHRAHLTPEVMGREDGGNLIRLVRSSNHVTKSASSPPPTSSSSRNNNNNNNRDDVIGELDAVGENDDVVTPATSSSSPIWNRVRGRKERRGVSRRSYMAAVYNPVSPGGKAARK